MSLPAAFTRLWEVYPDPPEVLVYSVTRLTSVPVQRTSNVKVTSSSAPKVDGVESAISGAVTFWGNVYAVARMSDGATLPGVAG